MDYTDGQDWADANEAIVTPDQNGRIVKYIEEQTAIWRFVHETDPDAIDIAMPVLILEFNTRDGNIMQVILPPEGVTSLNLILAEHWGRMWGIQQPTEVDLSDEAIDRLMQDINKEEGDK